MDVIVDFLLRFISQFQSPALAFLLGGMIIAALGSKLEIPTAIYQFCVFMLLMKIGMNGGMEIREAELADMLFPALAAGLIGIIIVALGSFVLMRLPGVRGEDGIATAGLFGAVSASTLAASMALLDEKGMAYEAWVPALYPFMDIPALILAILLANMYLARKDNQDRQKVQAWEVVKDTLRSSALSALLLGMALGLFTTPDNVFDSFYEPLFRGLLSVLMLAMGIEAYSRLAELRRVAHWYAIYAAVAPVVHGVIGFGFGYLAHLWVDLSPGGVVLLAILAAASSDVSGPPTLRACIPSANPSCYIGASTSVGTPVAIAVCIPLFIALADAVFA
ncbi:MAG: sodium-dependent bicarbonate transport family permease [Halioglobus sp.]